MRQLNTYVSTRKINSVLQTIELGVVISMSHITVVYLMYAECELNF